MSFANSSRLFWVSIMFVCFTLFTILAQFTMYVNQSCRREEAPGEHAEHESGDVEPEGRAVSGVAAAEAGDMLADDVLFGEGFTAGPVGGYVPWDGYREE